MTEITLYNTAIRSKERFEPLDADNVRMYVCGPTVYDRAHLGNARAAIVFDVLFRLLREVYGADHVTYARNITDVDDKINATALARKEAGAEGSLEELIRERSDETSAWYLEDMAALGALTPTHTPRATEWIGAMIAMSADLIERGHAYEAEGHVLFRVRSYKEYGALSGRSVDDMIAGARVEVAPYKEDPMDFVLWKPSDDELPGWDSPWGRGRPGWHIECSAMASELLGESFDIHGGGNDLQFPHHENEIAQSKCSGHGFARYWMHNEMLQVEGKKMSKSLGNFFTVRELLDQGVPGEVIRFVFLSTHYRKPMDWTAEKRKQAQRFLSNIYEKFESGLHNFHSSIALEKLPEWRLENLPKPSREIVNALADDLNTHAALEAFRQHARQASPDDASETRQVIANGLLLGFFGSNTIAPSIVSSQNVLPSLASDFEALREEAVASKNFAEVDKMKALLVSVGVEVRMTKGGVELVAGPDFDPAKLEALK